MKRPASLPMNDPGLTSGALPSLSDLITLGPVDLSPTQINLLTRYLDLFAQWNNRFHFSRFSRPESILRNLVYPSLSLIPFLADHRDLLDLGSGPGIPGIPIAIACPNLRATCCDSLESSIEFIATCRSELSLPNLQTIPGRAEILAHDPNLRDRFDIVISRAFAPIPVVVETSSAFARVHGLILMHTVKSVSSKLDSLVSEIAPLGCLFDRCGSILTPLLPDQPVYVALFRKIGETGSQYPRSWNQMKTRPLWTARA